MNSMACLPGPMCQDPKEKNVLSVHMHLLLACCTGVVREIIDTTPAKAACLDYMLVARLFGHKLQYPVKAV